MNLWLYMDISLLMRWARDADIWKRSRWMRNSWTNIARGLWVWRITGRERLHHEGLVWEFDCTVVVFLSLLKMLRPPLIYDCLASILTMLVTYFSSPSALSPCINSSSAVESSSRMPIRPAVMRKASYPWRSTRCREQMRHRIFPYSFLLSSPGV